LEYLSLSGDAYRTLKEAALKDEIVPGQKLSHEERVVSLGISQTPIREALARLAQAGYVSRLIKRGYRVSEMTTEEVAELFGLREALEWFCLSEIVRRMTPEGLL
jgi:DNA-binding GntR family transcriptional regulator